MAECTGKKPYLQKIDAVTAKNYIRKERGEELRIYPCPRCRHWHLTKHDKAGNKLSRKSW